MATTPHHRMETRNSCFVPVEGKNNTSFDHTQTVDISSHGIGFISSHPHFINEKIAVEIQLKPNAHPVLVIGIVKWVRKLPDLEQYRIGMNYDGNSFGSQRRLDRYFEEI